MGNPLAEELAPIVLPEFGGFKVSFAMCVNRMCPNFGVHYGTEQGADRGADSRYEIRDRTEDGVPGRKLVCRYCGIERSLHAARSIRPIARHFLSESLPFADCPREDCEHHGLNAYECMPRKSPGRGRRKERSPYHDNGRYYLKCNGRQRLEGKQCGASIPLGSPRVEVERDSAEGEAKKLALHLIRLGLSSTHANGFDLSADFFQRSVSSFGALFRDYHAYRNSFLLKPGACGQEDSTAVVVTDVLKVSLKRYGVGVARTQILNVIVSVLKLEDTWFVLAAHPYYLPREKCPELDELERDVEDNYRHRLLRRWAALRTPLDEGPLLRLTKPRKASAKSADGADGGDAEGKEEEAQPTLTIAPQVADAGHLGHIVRSPFAEVAHFLVVRKMLERFKRVFCYMDASYDLTDSVMVAMHDWVSSGRAHIAVMQHEKLGRRRRVVDRGPHRPREVVLPRAMAKMEERFAQRVAEELGAAAKTDDLWGGDDRERRARAIAWRSAPKGANSDDGRFAWLAYPANTKNYHNCNTLWLSRGPDDAPEDGRDLLMGMTLRPVDSACRTLRKRINTFKRPEKAAKGVSFVTSPYRVEGAMGELRTYLLMRNYARRPGKRWAQSLIPAGVLKLSDGQEVDMVDLLWSFRLDIEHAREVSQWLSA